MIAIVFFAVGAVYVVGGREFVRRMVQVRSRATAVLQPPTQAEMQRAARSSVGATASQTDANLPKPASLGMMAIWTGAILLLAVVMFVVTAWYPRRGDGA